MSIFASRVKLKRSEDTLEALLDKLSSMLATEKLDITLYGEAFDIVVEAQGSEFRDPKQIKMVECIKEFCAENLSCKALKAALIALKKEKLKGPVTQKLLEPLE